jgi:hypothetical protein
MEACIEHIWIAPERVHVAVHDTVHSFPTAL